MHPMRPQDWKSVPIEPGRYANREPMTGFQRVDGLGGNALHPTCGGDVGFEAELAETHRALHERYPYARVGRYTVQMPHWQRAAGPAGQGQFTPSPHDYQFTDAPQPLTTTSITVILVPQHSIRSASMGFHFRGDLLPTLRERTYGERFHGIAGNLGYYMTAGLVGHKFPWSHNRRYPQFPLPKVLSYIGFHLSQGAHGELCASFQGAHPAAVGIHRNGRIHILPRLDIEGYHVTLAGHRFAVKAIDDPHASQHEVALFTPACRTAETEALISELVASGGQSTRWQTCAPQIPLPDVSERVNVFVTNHGNGRAPIESVMAIWEGTSPLPSFGAVLSFKKPYFESCFGSTTSFAEKHVEEKVHIIPNGETPFHDYACILGGLVPVIVDGQHVCCADTVTETLQRLSEYGNAASPVAEAGRESRNFDPYIREPAGVLLQTKSEIGWVLFDGRHQLSIGASAVDVAQILRKLQDVGAFGQGVEQAVFTDGGSGMKAYRVESDGETVRLDLLNRVAAGSRNGPGSDPDGLNLYTLLALHLY
jgi:hypothetical protein